MGRDGVRRIRLLGTFLFAAYLGILVYFLFFSERYGRTAGDGQLHYNLMPLREIRRFVNNRRLLGWRITALNLAGNVAAFVPFGAILPVFGKKLRSGPRVVLLTALFSLGVEALQLWTGVGSFDVDDILLNTLGGLLGWGIFRISRFTLLRRMRP